MSVAIRYEIEHLQRLRQWLDPKVVDKALAVALQRTAMKARTAISREVRVRYNIKAGDIGKAVTIRRLQTNVAGRLLLYAGNMIGLDKFAALPKRIRTARGRRVGASVRIKKASGRKTVAGGFMADIHGNKIFKREGPDRLPIQRLFGPSIPHMVANQLVMDNINGLVGREAAIEFDRALARFLEAPA